MSESPRNTTLGTIANGTTAVVADLTFLGAATFITLSTDYAMIDPPGFPSRPSFTGAAAASLQYPRTVPSGMRFQVLACEATALVNAGAAVLS